MTSPSLPQCATCGFYHSIECPVLTDAKRQVEAARPASDRNSPRSAHDLMPAWLEAIIPALYEQDESLDPVVWVKFFTPDSSWTWYLTEYSRVAPDKSPMLGFGLVDGLEVELGYISLGPLLTAHGPMGLRIERDTWFEPTLLSEIRAQIGR